MPEYLEEELSPATEKDIKKKLKEESKELKKPYLRISDLNGDPRKEVQILEWIDFILSKTDMNGLFDSLSYYVEMDWISKDAKNHLLTYTRHFLQKETSTTLSTVKVGGEEYKIGGEEPSGKDEKAPKTIKRAPSTNLNLEEHFQSLNYILQISNRIDEKTQKETMEKAGITEKRSSLD